jgi:hypothetical protein
VNWWAPVLSIRGGLGDGLGVNWWAPVLSIRGGLGDGLGVAP